MKYYTTATIFYMFLIFYLSHIPQDNLPEEFSSVQNIDLLFHFVEYSVLGFLLFQSISVDGLLIINPLHATILIGTLFAISDEYHQSFVPGRQMSLMDIIFDSLGVLFGSFLTSKVFNSS